MGLWSSFSQRCFATNLVWFWHPLIFDTRKKKKVQNVPLEKKKYKTCRFGFGGLIRCRWVVGVQVWVSWVQVLWRTQIWFPFGRVGPGWCATRYLHFWAVTRDSVALPQIWLQIWNIRNVLGHIEFFRVKYDISTRSYTVRPKLPVRVIMGRTP